MALPKVRPFSGNTDNSSDIMPDGKSASNEMQTDDDDHRLASDDRRNADHRRRNDSVRAATAAIRAETAAATAATVVPPDTDADADADADIIISPEEALARTRRMKLIVLVKVLFEVLEGEDPAIRRRAQHVIRRCIRKNREGHPHHVSLVDSVVRHLGREAEIGPQIWKKTDETIRAHVVTHSLRCCKI